jgi:hypothetical protein
MKAPADIKKFLTLRGTTLLYSIPSLKPHSLTLNKKYSVSFLLNDHNPDGEKSATYYLYLLFYDPKLALDIPHTPLINSERASNSLPTTTLRIYEA